MLNSFFQKTKYVSSLLNLNNFNSTLLCQPHFTFGTNSEENTIIEDKIKSFLKSLGAVRDNETNIHYTQSNTKPLAGIKYSLESGHIPNLLLLEFYASDESDKFIQVLERQKSIFPRLMRNINYVSADNSIVIPTKLHPDEKKVLFNDIEKSAMEFYKNLINSNQTKR